jgi:CDGSH-type Zn-finger protein
MCRFVSEGHAVDCRSSPPPAMTPGSISKEANVNAHPMIECKPGGPIVVKNLDNLRDARGEPIEAKPVMALCCCGCSANNKPFCDGTHKKNGFSGAMPAERSANGRPPFSVWCHAVRCLQQGKASVQCRNLVGPDVRPHNLAIARSAMYPM